MYGDGLVITTKYRGIYVLNDRTGFYCIECFSNARDPNEETKLSAEEFIIMSIRKSYSNAEFLKDVDGPKIEDFKPSLPKRVSELSEEFRKWIMDEFRPLPPPTVKEFRLLRARLNTVKLLVIHDGYFDVDVVIPSTLYYGTDKNSFHAIDSSILYFNLFKMLDTLNVGILDVKLIVSRSICKYTYFRESITPRTLLDFADGDVIISRISRDECMLDLKNLEISKSLNNGIFNLKMIRIETV